VDALEILAVVEVSDKRTYAREVAVEIEIIAIESHPGEGKVAADSNEDTPVGRNVAAGAAKRNDLVRADVKAAGAVKIEALGSVQGPE